MNASSHLCSSTWRVMRPLISPSIKKAYFAKVWCPAYLKYLAQSSISALFLALSRFLQTSITESSTFLFPYISIASLYFCACWKSSAASFHCPVSRRYSAYFIKITGSLLFPCFLIKSFASLNYLSVVYRLIALSTKLFLTKWPAASLYLP